MTGSYASTLTFGSFSISSSGVSTDIFVAKYDASGEALWARSAGGPMGDGCLGIAVDDSGGSYVTGFFRDTANFGPFTLSSSGLLDIFVTKYDASGNVLWARSAGGAGSNIGRGIAVDDTANSYVTGNYAAATLGSFVLKPVGPPDIFVAKYAAPLCGNAIVESGEECDDNDLDNGDGCSSTCTVEPGYKCDGEPSVCITGIPAVSTWGLMVMTLLALTAGTVVIGRRRVVMA